MSRKTAQARKKALAQTKAASVRTESAVQPKPKTQPITQTRPEAPKKVVRRREVRKERGWALTAWLILLMIGSIVGIGLWFVILGKAVMLNSPLFPYWAAIMYIGIAILIEISAIAMFRWKKWGFYLFVAAACLSLIPGMALSQNATRTSLYAILPVCLAAGLVRPQKRWVMFD